MNQQTLKYDWVCASCGEDNPKTTDSCSACGFPARYTVKQLERHRETLLPGSAPETPCTKVVAPQLPASVVEALEEIRKSFWWRIGLGVVLAAIAALLVHRFAGTVTTSRHGMGLSILVVLGLFFWPAASYLIRLRCPRCGGKWVVTAKHVNKKHGHLTSWAVSSWRSCGTCGLTMPK